MADVSENAIPESTLQRSERTPGDKCRGSPSAQFGVHEDAIQGIEGCWDKLRTGGIGDQGVVFVVDAFPSLPELRGAVLASARLDRADFKQANLDGADFTLADLSGALGLGESDRPRPPAFYP